MAVNDNCGTFFRFSLIAEVVFVVIDPTNYCWVMENASLTALVIFSIKVAHNRFSSVGHGLNHLCVTSINSN